MKTVLYRCDRCGGEIAGRPIEITVQIIAGSDSTIARDVCHACKLAVFDFLNVNYPKEFH